jgi:hypothetical protein
VKAVRIVLLGVALLSVAAQAAAADVPLQNATIADVQAAFQSGKGAGRESATNIANEVHTGSAERNY